MTVISWCTYPVVYLFQMIGIQASTAIVSIGYCVADIISKCGVGLVIYQISKAKSEMYAHEQQADASVRTSKAALTSTNAHSEAFSVGHTCYVFLRAATILPVLLLLM